MRETKLWNPRELGGVTRLTRSGLVERVFFIRDDGGNRCHTKTISSRCECDPILRRVCHNRIHRRHRMREKRWRESCADMDAAPRRGRLLTPPSVVQSSAFYSALSTVCSVPRKPPRTIVLPVPGVFISQWSRRWRILCQEAQPEHEKEEEKGKEIKEWKRWS